MAIPSTTGTAKVSKQQALSFGVLEAYRPNAASALAGAATLNQGNGRITSEALTTAAGSLYTLTLTDSVIDSAGAAQVFASVFLGSSTQGTPQIVSATPGNGQVVIVVKNIDGVNAFNGTIEIDFMVVRQAPANL